MTKFENDFTPSSFDLVVTRHAGLAAWLRDEGYTKPDTPVVEHAHADLVEVIAVRYANGYAVETPDRRRVIRRIDVHDSLDGDHERSYAMDEIEREAKRIAAEHNAANIRGKHVVGVLPHHLSCLAASVTEVQLDIPRELRGVELTPEQTGLYARGLHTYVVRRQDAAHQHSSAVEAAWRYVEDHGTSFGAGPGILVYRLREVRGLTVTTIGSGDHQASAEIITSRGVWRPMCRGPWFDGLGREVAERDIEPAGGFEAPNGPADPPTVTYEDPAS